jgi:hypothetical protein
VIVVAVVGLAACGKGGGDHRNVLAGRVSEVTDVSAPKRLTNGVATVEGDDWNSDVTSVFGSVASRVVWDLGKATPIKCVFVQGDNNDSYVLFSSNDGKDFFPLWTAEPVAAAGMRSRQAAVDATTRYLMLSAHGGDGRYSVAEVSASSDCPSGAASLIPETRVKGTPIFLAARKALWLFCAASVIFILGHRLGGRRAQWLLLLVPVALGFQAAAALWEMYPFSNTTEESLVRAVVAAMALALVVKEAFLPSSWSPHPTFARATLGLLALLSVACYYHFGSAQFFDVTKQRRTVVHTWDMRNYFPTIKYFKELKFDGVYLASLAAYVDVVGGGDPRSVRSTQIRDLTTYEMISGDQAVPKMDEVRARFTPARWDEFRRDMKYFIDTMGGPDYLGSMHDHGGNATPVWLLGAWLVLRNAPANEWTLGLAGAIDPVLLALFFVLLWRTFGLRVMLYSLVVFGATDFYQLGSNLMGSTLRQDWLVSIGIGACCLKRGRHVLGGALLAYGGLIRAFPAIAALFLIVPLIWWFVDKWLTDRRAISIANLRADHRGTLRAIAGAAMAVILLAAVTTATFGAKDAWVTWFAKMQIHAVGPSTNNVGLRNILAWRPGNSSAALVRVVHGSPWNEWERRQFASFAQLRPLFYLVNALVFGLALFAARRRQLHQVVLIGLLLIPFLFYPSNYYCHFIFLLPMCFVRDSAEPRDRLFAWGTSLLLGLCIGQYFTLFERAADLCFTWQSMALLGAFLGILVPMALQNAPVSWFRRTGAGT